MRSPATPVSYPDTEQLASGVWSIRVPIVMGPQGGTLVYALETGAGLVLVDTGWDSDESWDALLSGIKAAGHAITDVYGVVVTHFHPDHHGLSGRVREAAGAWIAMHPLDAQEISTRRSRATSDVTNVGHGFLEAGAPQESFADIPAAGTTLFTIPPAATPDRLLGDGDLADAPGHSLRALWTPGHTTGHLCYVLEGRGLLFTGDHVLPRITPHIGLWMREEGEDPLGDFLASLDKLGSLEVETVLPAHEYRFTTLHERLEKLRQHHAVRLDAILDRARSGPASMWELAEAMPWAVPWERIPIPMRHLALSEARAHVRHLEVTGRLSPIAGESPQRYTLARP